MISLPPKAWPPEPAFSGQRRIGAVSSALRNPHDTVITTMVRGPRIRAHLMSLVLVNPVRRADSLLASLSDTAGKAKPDSARKRSNLLWHGHLLWHGPPVVAWSPTVPPRPTE